MITKNSKKNKINIITLGCSKNTVDSEVIYSQLKANKIDVVFESDNNDSNIVVINTCGFIDAAKEESVNTILKYVNAKQEGLIDKLIVTGCLSERYKPDLQREIPEVDEFFGTKNLPELLKTLGANYMHELLGERQTTTPSHYSYLKISEGCDRPCSFCAIPLIRGNHISKPFEQIEKEIKNLVKAGTKEILLIAQDSTYYGIDLYGDRKLPDLLKRISDFDGLEWLRLHYAYPSKFPEEVLDVMRDRSNICKYIDIPLQHISDNMLRKMRRGISEKRTKSLIDRIRDKVPEIAIRTTFIVGHPGESENDFDKLMNFVEETKFERMGVFKYSHEDGTHAGTMKDNVDSETKDLRASMLMELQEGISLDLNQKKLGKTYKVLFDRIDDGYFVGRTEFDSPEVDNEVLVKSSDNFVRIGDFADILINDVQAFDLYGVVKK